MRRGSDQPNGHSAFANDPRWRKSDLTAGASAAPTAQATATDAAALQGVGGSPASSSSLRLGVGGKAALSFIDIASGSVLNTRSGATGTAAHRASDDAGSRLESARSVATAMSHVHGGAAYGGAHGVTGRISEGVEDEDDVATEIVTARSRGTHGSDTGNGDGAAHDGGGASARPHGAGFYGVAARPASAARAATAASAVGGGGGGGGGIAGHATASQASVVREEQVPATPPRHGLRRPVSPIQSPGRTTTVARGAAHVKVLARYGSVVGSA